MFNLLDKSEFLSLFGLQKVWIHLKNSKSTDHATVSTHLNSGHLRVLLLRAKKNKHGQVAIKLKYFYDQGAQDGSVVDFLTLKCREVDGDIQIDSVDLLDHKIDIQDSKSLPRIAKTIKKFSEHVVHNNEWVNPVKLVEESGLLNSPIGRKAWPGLYVTGEIRNENALIDESKKEPVYPALFLYPVLGIVPDKYEDALSSSHSLALHGEDAPQKSFVVKYNTARAKTAPLSLTVTGTIHYRNDDGAKTETFYQVKTRKVAGKKKHAQITRMEILGEKIDLSNPEAVSIALKTIRSINRTIRAGDRALIEDLKKEPFERRYALPTELMLHTGLYSYLNKEANVPKKGLMTFVPVGAGMNLQKYVSDVDTNIGANQYVIGYKSRGTDGSEKSEGLMIDAGVLFHDIFDVAFFNAGRFLHHKHNKNHMPTQPVDAILFTHKHKDHLGQLAYLIKRGFALPPLIMNEMTLLQLKREMGELDIEKPVRDAILESCYAINLLTDINPLAPTEVKKTIINGTEIEHWTEVLNGKNLGQYHYYPRLRIGSFDIRIGPMPHSDPGLMFDVITPAGSHRHTGDYKIDDTIKLGLPPLDIWLAGHAPDSMSANSTGATREGRNPKEEDVGKAIMSLMEEHSERRFIFPMLGSNLARLTTLVDALGRQGRQVLIVDGKAVEDLVRDADKVHGLREWAKRAYGLDILIRTQIGVQDYLSDPARDSEYALLVSGTQDEFLSSINRATRNWLSSDRYDITENDCITFLQGVIPVGNNTYKRLALKEGTENFHGAKVILPEIIEAETDMFLHSSGHNNAADMADVILQSGSPFMIPVHGGPEQLEAHREIARKAGADSLLSTGSMSLRIENRKQVTPYHILPSEFIGIRLHTPSKEKFYLKGRFSASVLPIKPAFANSAHDLVEDFEQTLRKKAGVHSEYEMANSLPISLSRYFNAQVDNGYLDNEMPFGIDKYKGTVFEDKNIFAVAAIDTETGGLDADNYLMREFALRMETRGGDLIKETQLFQQIPDYRLPSVMARLVTNSDPSDDEAGLPPHLFTAQMKDAIKDVKEQSYLQGIAQDGESAYTRHDIKGLVVAHNMPFDARFIAKEMARNLSSNTRPQQTHGLIAIDTRSIYTCPSCL